MSFISEKLVTKVVSVILFFSITLANNMASAYTFTGSTVKPQGKFYDQNGKPISVTSVSNGTITFSNKKVAKIGNYAFHNCTGLKKFELPSYVTEVGYFAFANCDQLTDAVYNSKIFARQPQASASCQIADGIEKIASAAFRQCANLTKITLPSSVKTIGESAFAECSSLTTINIPANVESVGEYAFRNCTNLSALYIETNKVTGIKSTAFDGVDKTTCVLFVPKGKKSTYSNLGFSNVVEMTSTENNTGTPVAVITGSYSGEAFNALNDYVNASNALVVDLTNATKVDGTFVLNNKNVLFKTSKSASELQLKNTENVVVNGVCEKLVITDGFSFGTDAKFSAKKTSYSRSVNTTWGTICLPYKAKSDSNVQFYTSGSVTNGVLTLESTSTVAAGQPAIFKRITDSNLSVSSSSKVDVVVDVNNSTNSNSSESISLYGTFTAQNIYEEGLYYISNDKFWLKTPGSPLTVSPFRAWFSYGSNKANDRSLTIEESENESASLKAIDSMSEGTALYFDEQGHQLPDLQKGMNIVKMPDGTTKKVFLK